MDPHSLFSLNDHLEVLSQHGDPLEVLERTVDFEYFRSWLVEGLGYNDGSKGGRTPFDPVAMFKRGGSVCLNSLRVFAKWISALVMLLPLLASAH